ncbi:hypothetical protein GCM10010349_54130 [Streptomyces flavofungini]|nr:hypothetical protein GCM10010349_54130 [Streptomyces flavofungini]
MAVVGLEEARGALRGDEPQRLLGLWECLSVNARIRRAVKARGHFPNEQAAPKCVYVAIMSLDPTGKGQAR